MLCLLSNTPKIGYVAVDRYPEFLAGWVGAGGGGGWERKTKEAVSVCFPWDQTCTLVIGIKVKPR